MKTLIITTDFSESAMNAARYAVGLVGTFEIQRIILYHSYDAAPSATDIPVKEVDPSIAHELSLQALEKVEEELAGSLASIAVSISLVANELPFVVGVEQLVEQSHACLIVQGATGKSDFEQVLFGSNTISLVTQMTVPLLLVPKDAQFEPINTVVFACDLKEVNRSIIGSEISAWLKNLKAKLLVLNVARQGKRTDPDIITEQYKLHELLDSFNPSYHYTESDDIAAEIAAFAQQQQAGLIISVPKTHSFFEGLFSSSTSKRLIKESSIPLLLLKEKAL